MTLISLDKVSRSFGEVTVFEDVSLVLDEGDRVGVVGDNGSGKTTLIKVLAGQDEPDHGTRHCRRGLRIAYGAQIPELAPGVTVLDYVLRGDGYFDGLEQRIRELEAALAAAPDDAALLNEYGHLQGAFEAGGGYHRRHLCEKVLSGIGFDPQALHRDASVLSGGEKSRLVLSSLMTSPADLLILDEPTNHLDLEGIEFLEGFLRKYPGAVVVVSHDRRFLDNVAADILEIDGGRALRYRGNYTAYARQRDDQLLAQARAYKSQQEFVQREMDYIRRNMGSRMTAQAKGRLKRLQRMELLRRPDRRQQHVQLRFDGGRGLAGQAVLEVEGLGAVLPGGRVLFRQGSFRVTYGETLGILGRNGAGKTTLLDILGERRAADRGEVVRAPKVRPGYFSQEMNDLPATGTVLEALRAAEPLVPEKDLRDHLALFAFRGEDVDAPVATLSGGEKRRLCLARLVRSDFDYLCLDEPTNHLDITTREALEAALQDYPGAALVISHDRQFLEAVTDRILYLEDGRITVYDGGLAACLESRAEARRTSSPTRGSRPAKEPAPAAAAEPATAPGKIRNPLMFQKLEDSIMELEERLEGIRSDMALEQNYRDHGRMARLRDDEAALQRQLADAYERWENW